jgi:sugar lactone lactonase YvrE
LKLVRTLLIVAVFVAVAVLAAMRILLGGGDRLPDLTSTPIFDGSVLETVVELDYPPGNIAVSESGRVFFTLHPDGKPPVKVVELVDGKPVPYPNAEYQGEQGAGEGIPYFQSILSLRIDRQNRLWVLDFADFGRGQPRINAFDLGTDELLMSYEFPPDVAGLGSMLNDFQVSPDGTKVYIAETSPLIHRPAIVVLDVKTRTSRRVLDGHYTVKPRPYIIQAPGRDMVVYGLVALRIGVDSIALDRDGDWLYYGPVTGDRLYRIPRRVLDDESLAPHLVDAAIERFAAKTLSDGITTDLEGNVYLSDMEHSAVLSLSPDGELTTLVKDERLRWPDGFSFGPNGWLYVTCSSLQHVLFVSGETMRANAPYHIYRFKPGPVGVPGH